MENKDFIKENYEAIIENMVDGLFTVDPNLTITSWNKAAEEILGYTREEVLGKPCTFLESPTCMSYIANSKSCKCALFEKGTVVRKRCIVVAKNGETKHLIKNARLLRDTNGGIIGGVESIVDVTELVKKEQEIDQLKRKLKGKTSYYEIIGNHHTMLNLYELIDLAQNSSASVLIGGESGTGKEIIAHAIHRSSRRSDGPFVKVNCAALAESLLESELFGHVKGAFTDAVRDRKGRFEAAHGGTIFLDEIGDLPLSVQIKLLRVLQEKTVERVGENRPVTVDVRVIAATHRDLPRLIQEGTFREDLYYRLNVLPVRVPPLRERKTDIPLLLEHFLKKFREETGKYITGCDQGALDSIMRYPWPGNVRELENAIEYAFVTCRGDKIKAPNLPAHLGQYSALEAGGPQTMEGAAEGKAAILSALEKTGGNKTKAARLLGCSRVALWKKMKRLEMM